MKAYRMKIKGSGKDVGYRLVSDKGNCYDVILACRVVNSVCDNWENICRDLGIIEDESVPRRELLSRIISNVEGVLCEEVMSLNSEMCRS